MAYLVGFLLAIVVSAFAMLSQFDRDRSFYPTVLIVIASYYSLFAVMSDDNSAIGPEVCGLVIFTFLAVVGFKKNLWIVVGALCFHGLFDAIHTHLVANSGTPAWWPAFCLSVDISLASWLGWRIFNTKPDVA